MLRINISGRLYVPETQESVPILLGRPELSTKTEGKKCEMTARFHVGNPKSEGLTIEVTSIEHQDDLDQVPPFPMKRIQGIIDDFFKRIRSSTT